MLRRLTPISGTNVRKHWAGFHFDRDCIDQVFTLVTYVKYVTYERAQAHAHCHPTSVVVLYLKGICYFADRTVASNAFPRKCILENFVNLP